VKSGLFFYESESNRYISRIRAGRKLAIPHHYSFLRNRQAESMTGIDITVHPGVTPADVPSAFDLGNKSGPWDFS